jgi:pSer/pThr/pTyr-binding forkhead associated (FHA) protein
MSIGRVAGNDIVIPDTALSRQHARLEVAENGILLVDLGSLNGTFLNGERIEGDIPLTDGDVIRVGRTLLTVSLQPVKPAEPEVEEAAEATVAFDQAAFDAMRERESAPTMYVSPEELAASVGAAQGEEPAAISSETSATMRVEPAPVAIPSEEPVGQPPAPEESGNGAIALVPDEGAPTPVAFRAPEAVETSAEQTLLAQGQQEAPPDSAPAAPAVAGYLVAGDVRAPIITQLTVGRAEGNDIRIEGDRLVSRNHARLEARPDGVWLEDLNSANGTFKNDQQVTDPVLLEDGDEVRFGSTAYGFEAAPHSAAPAVEAAASEPEPEPEGGATEIFSEPEPTRGATDVLPAVSDDDSGATINISEDALALLAESAAAAERPPIAEPTGNLAEQYYLVVNFGPETGHSFPLLNEVTVIGRASAEADYDVQLNDRAVSRPHAKIVREQDGFTLYDMDSANGTWVNYTEEIAGPRRLADGDVLKLGKTTLIYRVPASVRPVQSDVILDPTAGQILTSFSLKGGVGTTAIAVNLAVAFRQLAQQSVLLVDLSTERGAVSVHMNVAPKMTLADLPQDPGSIDWDAVQSVIIHHSTGVDVLPAPPSPQTAELVTAAAVSAILPLARARYKWVIVDTSSTFSELNLGVFDQSDLLLLPVAPDMTSVKVMQSTLDVFAALQTPAERRVLILNQTHPKAHIGQPELEQHLGERIGLTLPYAEEAILDSIDQGVPLAATNPAHPTVAALQAFAARLAQVKVEAVEQQKRGGFGSWVQGLIGSLRK